MNIHPNPPNVDNESRVFHLQLTISKLQEELCLYRNSDGTTAEQFMELLGEKDMEIDALKKNNEKLQGSVF